MTLQGGRGKEREREERARAGVYVCVESALSLSCGQMEDGAASLLVLRSACHRLKGALGVFSSGRSLVPELTPICDTSSDKKELGPESER